jgi:thioredoxin-related protein/chorismate mutase
MKNLMKVSLVLLITFVSSAVNAQGIKFFKGTYEEALAKATTEGKMIFIDFYTSWCGPCKAMAKQTFTLKKVGNFYNKNFVCCKVDAEKGNGPELAKKYAVSAFPTFIYADNKGKALHNAAGFQEEEAFIELGKIAMNPKKRMSAKWDKFNAGKMSEEETKGFIEELATSAGDVSTALKGYVLSLGSAEKIYSKDTYELIMKHITNVNDDLFSLVVASRNEYAKEVGKEKVEQDIYSAYRDVASDLYNKDKPIDEVLKLVKDNGFDYDEQITEFCKTMKPLMTKQDVAAFIPKSKEYRKKYPNDQVRMFQYAALFMFAKNGLPEYVEKWSKELLKDKNNADAVYEGLVMGYAFTGEEEKAKAFVYKIKNLSAEMEMIKAEFEKEDKKKK